MPVPVETIDRAKNPGPRAPEYIARIAPYVPGKPIEELEREIPVPRCTKLASNENPLGPSPFALEAIRKALDGQNRYPDGSAFYLRQALASRHSVSIDEVIAGNGSTDLIELSVRTFLADGEPAVFGEQAFLMFRLAIESVNGRAVPIPMPDYRHDLPAMAAAARRERAKLVYLTNPNNPTGTWVTRRELDAFLDALPPETLTVLDEAYFEYVFEPDYPDGIELLRSGRNLLVLRTFSKIYGLAGLRIGYGLGRPEILAEMNKIRSPFNTSALAQAAALAAMDDSAHREKSRLQNREEMAFLVAGLQQRGVRYVPSVGNFVLILTDLPGGEVYRALLPKGVIVRPVANYGIPNAVRVSIGTREELLHFFEAWDSAFPSTGAPAAR
jgi:histidinol-phosphate aminotransferase